MYASAWAKVATDDRFSHAVGMWATDRVTQLNMIGTHFEANRAAIQRWPEHSWAREWHVAAPFVSASPAMQGLMSCLAAGGISVSDRPSNSRRLAHESVHKHMCLFVMACGG